MKGFIIEISYNVGTWRTYNSFLVLAWTEPAAKRKARKKVEVIHGEKVTKAEYKTIVIKDEVLL